jgi:hypothetical protein
VDLGDRLRRQEDQAEREFARLREEQTTTAAALRQFETALAERLAEADGKSQAARASRGRKASE